MANGHELQAMVIKVVLLPASVWVQVVGRVVYVVLRPPPFHFALGSFIASFHLSSTHVSYFIASSAFPLLFSCFGRGRRKFACTPTRCGRLFDALE